MSKHIVFHWREHTGRRRFAKNPRYDIRYRGVIAVADDGPGQRWITVDPYGQSVCSIRLNGTLIADNAVLIPEERARAVHIWIVPVPWRPATRVPVRRARATTTRPRQAESAAAPRPA